jgi:hypothetical protein
MVPALCPSADVSSRDRHHWRVDPSGAALPRPPEAGLDGVEDVFVFEPGFEPEWASGYFTVTRDMLIDSGGRMVPKMVWNGSDWVTVSGDWRP